MVKKVKKFDFLVCGNAGLNKFVDLDRPFEVGRTSHNLNENFDEFYLGGTGLNISYDLAKLGAKVMPVLAFGSDKNLEKLSGMFEELGMPSCALEPAIDGVFGYTILFRDSNGNHVTLVMHNSTEKKAPKPMQDEWFQNAEWGILGIARPENVVEFLKYCKKNNLPMAFSMKADSIIFPDSVLKEILAYSTIIFMNVLEKEYINNLLGLREITELFSRGKAKILVVSDGADGSEVYAAKTADSYRKIHVPATESNCVVDVSGAGDAYLSGFLYGLKQGKDLETCAQWGSTTAAFVIEKYGCISNAPSFEQMIRRNARRKDAMNNSVANTCK